MGQTGTGVLCQEFNGEQNSVSAFVCFLSSWGSGGMNINEIEVQVRSYDLGKCYEGDPHAGFLRNSCLG